MVRTHTTWYCRQIFSAAVKAQAESARQKQETPPPPGRVPAASTSPYEREIGAPK